MWSKNDFIWNRIWEKLGNELMNCVVYGSILSWC